MTSGSATVTGEGGEPSDRAPDQPETEPGGGAEEATDVPAAPDEPELSLDLVFKILKNQRRRYILKFLSDREGPVSLSDLSEFIAAEENDKMPAELSSQERKRAYVGLYQCHLPMMDDAGIIDFNKDRGRIELKEQASLFDAYLDKPTDPPVPWHGYYLALAVLGGVVAAASLVVPALPVELVGVAQATVLGALALAHGWKVDTFERTE